MSGITHFFLRSSSLLFDFASRLFWRNTLDFSSSVYLTHMKYISVLLLLSLCLFSLSAQIPVEEETLHHVLYEDEEIRILEIIALPGDTAAIHQHNYNYCYISTAGGKMWLEDEGEEGRTVNLPTHYAGGKFELNEAPFIHRFANIDTSLISFFTVEHKLGKVTREVSGDLMEDNILTSKLFSIRKLRILPLSARSLPHQGTAVLLNLNKDSLLSSGNEKVVYWKCFDAQELIQIQNMGKETIDVALFEIF